MDRNAWRILWDNLESLLMGGVLLVLLSLLVVDIGRRVVTGSPLLWVEEMVPILFVWVVFVGAAGAIKGRFGPELGRSRQLLLLLMAPVLIYSGVLFMRRSQGYLHGSAAIGCILLFIRLLEAVGQRLRGIWSGGKKTGGDSLGSGSRPDGLDAPLDKLLEEPRDTAR